MNMFLQQLVTGISIGSVYALLAVGYALVFSVFNFSNFGFGPVMMLGAFAAFYAIPALNLPLFPSILLAMVVAGLVSFIMELTVYRPMRQKKTLKLYLMIAGLGINTFVPNAAIQIFGGGVHAFPSDWARVTIHGRRCRPARRHPGSSAVHPYAGRPVDFPLQYPHGIRYPGQLL